MEKNIFNLKKCIDEKPTANPKFNGKILNALLQSWVTKWGGLFLLLLFHFDLEFFSGTVEVKEITGIAIEEENTCYVQMTWLFIIEIPKKSIKKYN